MINEGPTFGRFFKLNDLPNALRQPRQIVRAILLPEGGGTLGFFFNFDSKGRLSGEFSLTHSALGSKAIANTF